MKKALYIILALCLIFSLAACGGGNSGGGTTETTEAAKTEGNGVVSTHVHCVCVGKAVNVGEHKECSSKDGWVEISTAKELTDAVAAASAAKPAYLALTADIEVDAYMDIAKGAEVYICLNGKTLTAATRNIGGLHITDCTGNGTWTSKKAYAITVFSGAVTELYAGNVTVSDEKPEGQVFVLDGSAKSDLELERDAASLLIYGGKIYMDHITTVNGACIWAGSSGKIYLYNGTVTGATIHTDDADARYGGNISLASTESEMFMYGGEVTNGYLKVNGKGGTTSGGWGGNIGSRFGALYVYGGVISGGYANGNGGNIGTANSAGVFYLENCTVKDGKAENFGGNFYFNGKQESHLVTLKNVTVTGGEADKSGGNIFNQSSTLTIEGGEISGGKSDYEPGGGIAFQGTDHISAFIGNIKFENNQGSDLLLRKHSSGKLPYLSLAELTTATDIVVAGNNIDSYIFCEDAPANHTLKAADGFTITADGTKLTISNG